MGKRVRFAMRSVITGDQFIKIDEVGVPLSIAKNIQIPEVVRPWNKHKIMIYYMNKDKKYPGCSRIIKKSNGITYRVSILEKENYILQEGDTVLRDMVSGDYIGFNRQPSLLISNISEALVESYFVVLKLT